MFWSFVFPTKNQSQIHYNDSEKPHIDIYIDLLTINFNLPSVLLHCASHPLSDYEIYTSLHDTALTTNM